MISGIEFGITVIGRGLFPRAGLVDLVRMNLGGQPQKTGFERIGINPGPARLLQQGEVIHNNGGADGPR